VLKKLKNPLGDASNDPNNVFKIIARLAKYQKSIIREANRKGREAREKEAIAQSQEPPVKIETSAGGMPKISHPKPEVKALQNPRQRSHSALLQRWMTILRGLLLADKWASRIVQKSRMAACRFRFPARLCAATSTASWFLRNIERFYGHRYRQIRPIQWPHYRQDQRPLARCGRRRSDYGQSQRRANRPGICRNLERRGKRRRLDSRRENSVVAKPGRLYVPEISRRV